MRHARLWGQEWPFRQCPRLVHHTLCALCDATLTLLRPPVCRFRCRSDTRFEDTSTLEEDAGFPHAFFVFMMYLYEHRPSTLDSQPMPALKAAAKPGATTVVPVPGTTASATVSTAVQPSP